LTKLLVFILLIQTLFISCQSDNNLDEIIDKKFQFSIFEYEVNSVMDLFFERYGLRETEPKKNQIRKLLISELYDQEMDYFFDIIFPSPEFNVGSSPKLLVTSPRNKIERKEEILLVPSIDIETIEELEGIASNDELSSVIINIGGLATYPSIIAEGKSSRELFLTISHEWLHQYLIFHPLGRSYFSNTEMKEINETLANIFSKKLLKSLCEKDFEIKNEMCSVSPLKDENKFDYREFMKKLRINVDQLLSEGKINNAEKLMNESTLILNNNGIKIRKINQAWFAFNGTYGDSPSSTSNFNDELNNLINSYGTLKDAINDIKNISSLDEHIDMIK